MSRPQPSLHDGVWYWPTRDAALDFAAADPLWSRVLEYGRGWAVQAGHTGNFAGPGVEPKWRGMRKRSRLHAGADPEELPNCSLEYWLPILRATKAAGFWVGVYPDPTNPNEAAQ
jgi:hypothetical protein